MKNIKSYYMLDSFVSGKGHSNILNEITEHARKELLSSPKTTQQAQETVINWWNNLFVKPKITSHRLSYFCLYHLRNAILKKKRVTHLKSRRN